MRLMCISFFFSSRRRHTRWPRDWSSDVCSSDLRVKCPGIEIVVPGNGRREEQGLAIRAHNHRADIEPRRQKLQASGNTVEIDFDFYLLRLFLSVLVLLPVGGGPGFFTRHARRRLLREKIEKFLLTELGRLRHKTHPRDLSRLGALAGREKQ